MSGHPPSERFTVEEWDVPPPSPPASEERAMSGDVSRQALALAKLAMLHYAAADHVSMEARRTRRANHPFTAKSIRFEEMDPTVSNILIGVLSAIVDNIPVMYAVLKMDPSMGLDQWLLITLTVGTGGSLLSIGSAAGVAVMGIDRNNYTFMSHLKWMPAIALGYLSSIATWYFVTSTLR